jgi:hypothetical protein
VAVQEGEVVELHSPDFVYRLNTADGLKGVSWTNLLTDRTISLGLGPELEVDLDVSDERIAITEWRCTHSQSGDGAPDEDIGYREGFFKPDGDDSQWQRITSPAMQGPGSVTGFDWARTRVVIPPKARNKHLTLVIGGFGVFDYRYTRVFVGGRQVAEREACTRWHEPLSIELGPQSDIHRHLRFGQENVIALQLSGFVDRVPRLDQLDPQRARALAMRSVWPAQYEQYLLIGRPPITPELRVVGYQVERHPSSCEAIFRLRADDQPIAATVRYQYSDGQGALRKFVDVTNMGKQPLTVLNIRLGDYATDIGVSDGEQGFPVYLDGQYFMTLAHPSGWAMGQDGRVSLRHYPGATLLPEQKLHAMETVYGVADAGRARDHFIAYVRSRTRRVDRGHDRPYAIFDNFGSWPLRDPEHGDMFTKNTEKAMLHGLERLSEMQKLTGRQFDLCNIHLWFDINSKMTRFDPQRFPHGFAPIKKKLDELGIAPGLWIASHYGSWATVHPSFAGCCRAQEPLRSAYAEAFRFHIRENGVRLAKFDGQEAMCYHPGHNHLPGVYSTEAIHNAVIDTLRGLDDENPDVFLMLYWGHRSPWWLLHGDTLFEPGVFVEAAHPGPYPTMYARDSVTQGLDQAHWFCQDVPRIGKDSLGVWLSDWWWNSSIGKERWQEGLVMDMCRGSLLLQLWADYDWLSPPEWTQMATLFDLVRAAPECFAHCRFVLGNPWRNEPYGYCCGNGQRAFIALNNCTWRDKTLTLELNAAWGLPNGRRWDLYRWYPDPARLNGKDKFFGQNASIAMRPFEIILLEAVPSGEPPSLEREFPERSMPTDFVEPSRPLDITVGPPERELAEAERSTWTVLEPTEAVSAGGA